MPLATGARLGAYEILSPLGAGGMGEVYRARDSRLSRDIAIKVLPETVAQDAERLARFEREARALAALNHPGIVTIFAVEESAGTRFLAMELVEGESLDMLIATGGLSLSRFFDIATPLAEALSAAHERGIVHRDLKPNNVMVTREGRVKVLDFGLARVEAPDSDANLTSTPTESRANLTSEGQVFGTVAYMSPEQARGGRVDARSDVFSLGIVLYQMLTGERPFQGASAVDLISSILRDKPPSVTDLRADVPPHLSRILRRCLEKDPRDRYQTSRDVYNELKELRIETSSGSGPSAPPRSEAGALLRPPSGPVRAEEGFWIAVLPFKYGGSDASLTALAEGLTEEIATGLSRFRYLSVVASASAAHLDRMQSDERALGARLGARYVLEGGIREAGSAIRVSAQLVDAETGARLWSETYGRDLKTTTVFEAQDDVAARIVATAADSYGVLVHSIRSAMRQKDDVHLTPVEWQFQYFAYREQITPAAHAELKSRLERAVERDGRQSDLWACLAQLHVDAYAFGFQGDASSLDRALAAARRAVELDRSNQFALVALAQTHFFRQDLAAFGPATERAMALNPLNTDAVGILGLQIVHTGEFERGAAIVRRAMELNPNHAGWMHFAPLWEHFHKGEYEQALERANRVDVPGLFWPYLVMASACGHLGRRVEAQAAVRDLLALDPDFEAHARSNVGTWHFASDLMDPILEGLRKAGLDVPEPEQSSPAAKPAAAVSIAVLPFTDMSPAKDQEYLCEGMAEEIMNSLVRVEGIRVASRTSTFQARRQAPDLTAIGKLLSVGHILEGSVRTAGDRLRVTAQLTDVASGFQIWSERFDRDARDVFAVQDEIAAGVVDAVKARLAPGTHAVHARPQARNLEAYRAYLKGRHLRGIEDHVEALRAFEEAVRLDPSHAPSWTGLAEITVLASVFGVLPARDACATARKALATATRLQGESSEGLHVEAFVAWIERRWPAMEAAWRRAIELQPDNVLALASFGIVLCTRQRLDEALPFLERARQADPLASFPYALTGKGLVNCGRPQEALRHLEDALSFEKEDATALESVGEAQIALGRFDEGISTLERVVAISHRGAHFLGTFGWALATAGRTDEARRILEELRARPPAAPTVVSEAWLLGALGEVDEAFEVVERAQEEYLAFLYFTGLPGFDPIRSDPRFAALLRKLDLSLA
jgi:TolB-like protein/Tfp pilus assembly protein PilF